MNEYLVVDLAPSLIFKVEVLESLQAINSDIEIRGVKNFIPRSAASYFMAVMGRRTVCCFDFTVVSVPKNGQHVLVIHEIFRNKNGTTLLHCSC